MFSSVCTLRGKLRKSLDYNLVFQPNQRLRISKKSQKNSCCQNKTNEVFIVAILESSPPRARPPSGQRVRKTANDLSSFLLSGHSRPRCPRDTLQSKSPPEKRLPLPSQCLHPGHTMWAGQRGHVTQDASMPVSAKPFLPFTSTQGGGPLSAPGGEGSGAAHTHRPPSSQGTPAHSTARGHAGPGGEPGRGAGGQKGVQTKPPGGSDEGARPGACGAGEESEVLQGIGQEAE